MKTLFFFCSVIIFVAVVVHENYASVIDTTELTPQRNSTPPTPVVQSYENTNDGNYTFSLRLDANTEISGNGQFKEVDGKQVYEVTGHIAYIGADGIPLNVRYIGNSTGFYPVYRNIKRRINPKAVAGILG